MLAAALLIAACAGTDAPRAQAAAPVLPPQGVYDSCRPAASSDGCASRLQRIGRAGFKVVMNGGALSGVTARQVVAYGEAARAAGVKVIWPISTTSLADLGLSGSAALGNVPLLSATCGCTDNAGLLAYLVSITRQMPNTWGYYLADEPRPDRKPVLSALTDRIRALDPAHSRTIMTCGICVGDPAQHAAEFADLDVAVGTDVYPVYGQAPDDPGVYGTVADTMRKVQAVADRAGRQTIVSLQAWNWGDSRVDAQMARVDPAAMRFPTRREIEMQRNAAIENGRPSLILWFTLQQVIGPEPGQRDPNWTVPGDSATRWANLVGGAFAPLPNKTPTAAISLRPRRPRARGWIRVSAGRSADPDGRIASYRWYTTGRARAVCRRARCRIRARRRAGRQRLRLVVTDDRGARATAVKRVRVRSRAR